MADILIIKLSALGDLVQADGAMRDIRAHHPHDRLTAMTTPPYRRYMERCPWVDDVLIDPRSSRFNILAMSKLRKALHEKDWSRVYDLQQVGRTRFYYRWLFSPVPWLGDAPGCTFYLKRCEETTCAADHFARHLRLAGVNSMHTLHGDLSWMANNVEAILDEAGLIPGYVVLIPGTSASHRGKRWPYFKELALRLHNSGMHVVTVPGPDDRQLCRSFPGTMLVPASGYYDFFDLAGIVKNSRFVVGNDTGPTHIAAQLGCPGLALFGSHTTPETTGIQHTSFTVLESSDLAKLTIDRVYQQMGMLLK